MANGEVTEDQLAVQRLRGLKHVVVVMMENRSFDHMLGFLSLEGMSDVDGLTGNESNLDRDLYERRVHAFHADAGKVQRPGEALQKKLDPDHSPKGVEKQLGPGYGDEGEHNKGFVRSFIESRNPKHKVTKDLWDVPMGYYTSNDLPVYDHLARQYCVCDRWYSSIPGDTWPNRVYATTGTHGPSVAKEELGKIPVIGKLLSGQGLPLYDLPAFTRQLSEDSWRWYSHDPGTLRLVDKLYRNRDDLKQDNFAFFDRRKVNWFTKAVEAPILREESFLDDVARNKLPKVSWIDPNFVDVRVFDSNSNDDHPPADIRAGQAFVMDIYDALLRSAHWDDTLLVITYDEHGGFYDHVMPPPVHPDDDSKYKTYGVRVPALIVGPRVRRGVLHEPGDGSGVQYDHTSLIKTILLAAADDPDEALSRMPGRVQRAPHLGGLLLDEPRDDIDEPQNARTLMDVWRDEARKRREARPPDPDPSNPPEVTMKSRAPDGAGHPVILTDFQEEFIATAAAVKQAFGANP